MSTLATPIGLPAEQMRGSAAYETIEAYLEQQMRRLRIPGAALAIVEGDRIVHLRGFGAARPGGPGVSPPANTG